MIMMLQTENLCMPQIHFSRNDVLCYKVSLADVRETILFLEQKTDGSDAMFYKRRLGTYAKRR